MSVIAYLDPASGSLIAATAAAGLAGVGVAAKSAWHNRTSRFRKSSTDDVVDSPEDIVDVPDSDDAEPAADDEDRVRTAVGVSDET